MTTLQTQELASSPGHPLDGMIRIWGNPGFQTLAKRSAERFRAHHPEDRVALHLTGSDTGMAGLYTGEADLALLARPATDSELQAFEWVFRRPPTCVEIAARGFGVTSRTPRGRPLFVYLDSGQGAQPLAPVFLHDILSQSGRSGHSCTATR